ncbi:pirin family protein [Candidatus Woesearchaeota archaeon]|nr:pirin family protein [Candidatus Woesearchaeota archaeon]
MQKTIYKAQERGTTKIDWLDSKHSFSFGEYYNEDANGFGDLLVLNDDSIEPNKGFGLHPHNNMEIISIILEGTLQHTDSMGNTGKIHKHEVQVMSAGTGVRHSEVNPSTTEKVNLLQIWITPNQLNVKPRYDQKKFTLKKNTLTTIVSGEKNKESLFIHQDATINLLELEKGKKSIYTLNPSRGAYLFVIEGTVTVAGETLNPRDALAISDTQTINLEATTDAKILIIDVNINNKTQEN